MITSSFQFLNSLNTLRGKTEQKWRNKGGRKMNAEADIKYTAMSKESARPEYLKMSSVSGDLIINAKYRGTPAKEVKVETAPKVSEDRRSDRATVEENLAFPLQSLQLDRNRIFERIQQSARKFGLTEILDRDILTLSGGQRQLVSIAAALISEPSILLLDEPLSMMDRQDRESILQTVSEIVGSETSVLFATNRFSEVVGFDRFVIIGNRRKLFDGGIEELKRTPSVFYEAGMSVPFEIVQSC